MRQDETRRHGVASGIGGHEDGRSGGAESKMMSEEVEDKVSPPRCSSITSLSFLPPSRRLRPPISATLPYRDSGVTYPLAEKSCVWGRQDEAVEGERRWRQSVSGGGSDTNGIPWTVPHQKHGGAPASGDDGFSGAVGERATGRCRP